MHQDTTNATTTPEQAVTGYLEAATDVRHPRITKVEFDGSSLWIAHLETRRTWEAEAIGSEVVSELTAKVRAVLDASGTIERPTLHLSVVEFGGGYGLEIQLEPPKAQTEPQRPANPNAQINAVAQRFVALKRLLKGVKDEARRLVEEAHPGLGHHVTSVLIEGDNRPKFAALLAGCAGQSCLEVAECLRDALTACAEEVASLHGGLPSDIEASLQRFADGIPEQNDGGDYLAYEAAVEKAVEEAAAKFCDKGEGEAAQ